MGQLAIVNAPSSFTWIWSFIKPWISKETAAKVDVLGRDYKEVLLSMIDAENLPSTLGGSCTCSEAGGCHLSGAGPWLEGRKGWGPKAKEKEAAEAASKKAETHTDQDTPVISTANESSDQSSTVKPPDVDTTTETTNQPTIAQS
jgi:hypothetical protein